MKLILGNTNLIFKDFDKKLLNYLKKETSVLTLDIKTGETYEDALQKSIFLQAHNQLRYRNLPKSVLIKERENLMKRIATYFTGYTPLIKYDRKSKLYYTGAGLLPEILDFLKDKNIVYYLIDKRSNVPEFSLDLGDFTLEKTIQVAGGDKLKLREEQIQMSTLTMRTLELPLNCIYSSTNTESYTDELGKTREMCKYYTEYTDSERLTKYLYFPNGLFNCATNTGKTPAMMKIAQQKKSLGKTIILVNTDVLFAQHIEDFQKYFNEVGWIGQKSKKSENFKDGSVIIAKVDSIPSYLLGDDAISEEVQRLVKYQCDLLLVDEAEVFMAENKTSEGKKSKKSKAKWEGGSKAVVRSINASARFGFSGTIKDVSLLKQKNLQSCFSDILLDVDDGNNVEKEYSLRTDVLMLDCPHSGIFENEYEEILQSKISIKKEYLHQLQQDNEVSGQEIQHVEAEIQALDNANRTKFSREMYFEIQTNVNRNRLLAEITAYMESLNLSSLIYIDKLEFQLPAMQEMMSKKGVIPCVITGEQSKAMNSLSVQNLRSREILTGIGTKTILRGINIPSLQCCVYNAGGKSNSRLSQFQGRGQRSDSTKDRTVFEPFLKENPKYDWAGKRRVFNSFLLIDFIDTGKYGSAHSKERINFWKKNTGATLSFGKGLDAVKNYMKNRVD